MLNNIMRIIIIFSAVFLTACVSNTAIKQDVPIEERQKNIAGEGARKDNSDWRFTAPASTENLEQKQEQSHSSASAVTSLANQAREEYIRENYSRAIALAERALRINRRSPELYLILAECYWKKLLPAQSKQFAQRGLRYSPKNSEIYHLLSNLSGQL